MFPKNCGNCAYIPLGSYAMDTAFCEWDSSFAMTHIARYNWYPKQLVEEPPQYISGARFPHCPNCNTELDIFLAPYDFADDYLIQANYCRECVP